MIADIQARTWRWAYSDFIAEDDMPVAAERVPAWREHIAGGGVRVFDQDGTVVGYVGAVAGRRAQEPLRRSGRPGRRCGRAAARRRAGAHPRGAGTRAAWLYVFADNAHGCAFYERHGWVAVRRARAARRTGARRARRYEREP